jgi:hypothetical protein
LTKNGPLEYYDDGDSCNDGNKDDDDDDDDDGGEKGELVDPMTNAVKLLSSLLE